MLGSACVALAIYALATPSFASARAAAIRDFTSKARKLKQYTWGDTEIDIYRACMAQQAGGSNAAQREQRGVVSMPEWLATGILAFLLGLSGGFAAHYTLLTLGVIQ
jgi:hypothetical protein